MNVSKVEQLCNKLSVLYREQALAIFHYKAGNDEQGMWFHLMYLGDRDEYGEILEGLSQREACVLVNMQPTINFSKEWLNA